MSRSIRNAMGEGWAKSIEKEDALRSLWFRQNEERLNEIANKVPSRRVPDDIKEKMKQVKSLSIKLQIFNYLLFICPKFLDNLI